MNSQLTCVSILSGVLWGIIAMVSVIITAGPNLHILRNLLQVMISAGTPALLLFGLTGAVVGLLTGFVLQRVPRQGMLALAAIAGITLLVTTIVFAILGTTAGAILSGEVYSSGATEQILQAPIWWLYGLFASGFVVFLWPLAVLNHLWFFRIRDRQQRQST